MRPEIEAVVPVFSLWEHSRKVSFDYFTHSLIFFLRPDSHAFFADWRNIYSNHKYSYTVDMTGVIQVTYPLTAIFFEWASYYGFVCKKYSNYRVYEKL